MDRVINLKKGMIFALIAAVISGVAIFYAKVSLAKLPPLILTTSRNSVAGLLFIFYFLIFGKFYQLKKLKKIDWVYLMLIGLIGGSLPFYLFFTGLSATSAITANLIHKTLFIFVTIFAYFFLKERYSLSYFVSFFLIFIANFVVAGVKWSFGRGELLIFLATLLWSVENIVAKRVLKRVSSEMVGLFRMGIGGFSLLLVTLLSGRATALLTISNYQLTIIIIGGSLLFAYVFFWYKALKYAPAGLVTLILTFSVVVGNVLNGSFAGVKIPQKDIYTSLLITLAIFVLLTKYLISKILGLKSTLQI